MQYETKGNSIQIFPSQHPHTHTHIHFVMDQWMQTAKEQLGPISAMLEKLQQEREELVVRRRQQQEEGQEKVGCLCTSMSLLIIMYCICNLFVPLRKHFTLLWMIAILYIRFFLSEPVSFMPLWYSFVCQLVNQMNDL